MSFDITDLGDRTRFLNVNGFTWRPTLAIIEASGIVPEVQCEAMSFNLGYGSATRDQALALVSVFQVYLDKMAPGNRISEDGAILTQPDDFRLHRDDVGLNYSVPRDWLSEFVSFLASCDGFEVT